jgi:lipopolysaccharide transport system ATP-binding protein
MSDIAITATGISKQYRLGLGRRHDTLRDHVMAAFGSLRGRRHQRHVPDDGAESVWALKDISFEIKKGEPVGFIGRNGAGKSTLLKILSRITEPTTGWAEIHGRVASLLEVGTGFHGELTGRENIYLNGAILGMKKAEISARFDEIVAFAEVEKFIDTPVKRYSSGMYLRLAFAVAAHLEPEILIVDEVLAVGDANFQKKCLNRMQDVGKEGRTVLFVSHNMQTITRLCKRALLLHDGSILQDGEAHQVVSTYLKSGIGMTGVREYADARAPGNDIVRVRAVRVRTDDGRTSDVVDIDRPVGIEMEFEVIRPGHVLTPCYGFTNEEGVPLFVATDRDPAWQREPRPVGRFVTTGWIPGNLLTEGTITVGAGIITEDPFTLHCDDENAVAFQVVEKNGFGAARGDYAGQIPGVIRPLLTWDTQFTPGSSGDRFAAGALASTSSDV